MIHQLSINYIVREEPLGASTSSVLSGLNSPALCASRGTQPEVSPELIPNLEFESWGSEKADFRDLQIGSPATEPGKVGLPALEFSFEETGLLIKNKNDGSGKNKNENEMRSESLMSQKIQFKLGNFNEFSGPKNNFESFGMNRGDTKKHVLTAQLKTPGKLQMKALYDEKTDVTRNFDGEELFCNKNLEGSFRTRVESPVIDRKKTSVKKSRFCNKNKSDLENLQFLGNLGVDFTPNSFLTPINTKAGVLKNTPTKPQNYENELNLAEFDMIQDLEFESLVPQTPKLEKERSEYQLEDFELKDDANSFEAPSVCVEDYILPSHSELTGGSSCDSVSESSDASSITSQSEAARTEFSEAPVFTQSLVWEQERAVLEREEKEFVTSLELAIDSPKTLNGKFCQAESENAEIMEFGKGFKSHEELMAMEEKLDALFGLKEDALAATVNGALNERMQKQKLRKEFAYVGVGLDYDYLEALEEEVSVILDDGASDFCEEHQLVILRAGVIEVDDFELKASDQKICGQDVNESFKSLNLVDLAENEMSDEIFGPNELFNINQNEIDAVRFLRFKKEMTQFQGIDNHGNLNNIEQDLTNPNLCNSLTKRINNTEGKSIPSFHLKTINESDFHCRFKEKVKLEPDKCRCREICKSARQGNLNEDFYFCDTVSKNLSDAINKSDLKNVVRILARDVSLGEKKISSKSVLEGTSRFKNCFSRNFEIKSLRTAKDPKNLIRLEILLLRREDKTDVKYSNFSRRKIWIEFGFEKEKEKLTENFESKIIKVVNGAIRNLILEGMKNIALERVYFRKERPEF